MFVSSVKISENELKCLPKVRLRDTFLLSIHLNVSKFLGLHPWEFRIKKCAIGQIYAIMFLLFTAIVAIWTSIVTLLDDIKRSTVFQLILNLTQSFVLTSFFTIFLVNSITKAYAWKTFLGKLSQFDDHFAKYIEKVERKQWKISMFILIRLAVIFYYFVDEFIWYRKSKNDFMIDTKLFLPEHIALFCQMTISLMIWEISELIKSRYNFMKQYVEILCINRDISRQEFDKEIEMLKYFHNIIFDVVQAINDIFGNVVFVFLVHVETVILSNICLVIFYDSNVKVDIYLDSCLVLVVYLVSDLDKN